MDGNEVHKWKYSQIEGEKPQTGLHSGTWHYSEMLPNGNLLAIVKDVMILELDWNSNLLWKKETRAHHAFDRLENGNTMVLSRKKVFNKMIYPDTITSDYLVELTPDNKVVWEWHSNKHAVELKNLVYVEFPVQNEDWAHTNTVEVLRDNILAQKDTRFKAGNILISMKHINTIAVIDRNSKEIVWAWGPGILDGQHMPTLIDNGHIRIYDNGYGGPSETHPNYTRILELDVLKNEIVWEYKGDPPESFFSKGRGSNQRLPNGNTLIAESNDGRAFEVTMDGEIVWEYINPDRDPREAKKYPRCFV